MMGVVPILEKEMEMTRMEKMLRVGAAGLMALALSLSAVPEASAEITLKSRISSTQGQAGLVLIQPDSQISPNAFGVLKFKFATPEKGEYKIRFCFGAAADPCGGASSYAVTLTGGEERLAVIPQLRLRFQVLFVVFEGGQAAVDPIPFEVTIE
jgi:hypothetical protein